MDTITTRTEGAVLFAELDAPPMNLLGPELVRDLVTLIRLAESDDSVKVLVFKSADPDYFISHVDLARVTEYRAEAATLTGEASIASLFRHVSASGVVTIAQIEGRVRGAGSEFVLACDMRFAARDRAIFCQFEPAFGQVPGGGAVQYLTRLMGRARARQEDRRSEGRPLPAGPPSVSRRRGASPGEGRAPRWCEDRKALSRGARPETTSYSRMTNAMRASRRARRSRPQSVPRVLGLVWLAFSGA